jgi:hypothetical protein
MGTSKNNKNGTWLKQQENNMGITRTTDNRTTSVRTAVS